MNYNSTAQVEILTLLKTGMSSQGTDRWETHLSSFIVSHKTNVILHLRGEEKVSL